MNDQPDPSEYTKETQTITVNLPCRLAERVDKYARENGNTDTGVW